MTRIYGGPYLTVRTEGDPVALAADLRAIVRNASKNSVID
jgi:hypothetical protein